MCIGHMGPQTDRRIDGQTHKQTKMLAT